MQYDVTSLNEVAKIGVHDKFMHFFVQTKDGGVWRSYDEEIPQLRLDEINSYGLVAGTNNVRVSLTTGDVYINDQRLDVQYENRTKKRYQILGQADVLYGEHFVSVEHSNERQRFTVGYSGYAEDGYNNGWTGSLKIQAEKVSGSLLPLKLFITATLDQGCVGKLIISLQDFTKTIPIVFRPGVENQVWTRIGT